MGKNHEFVYVNNTVSNSDCVTSNGRMVVNDELEQILKETAMA
jgi:hypothetical protein